MKHYILFFLVAIFYYSSAYSQTIITGGEVSGTWSSSNSPYWIQGDIEVPENSNLTIEPGTYIEFQGHYKLDVNGVLSAVGTITDSIYFTIDDTTNFYNISIPDGGWEGIKLIRENNPDTSMLAYCSIRFAKPYETTSTDLYGRAVTIQYGNKIRIINCRMIDNKGHLMGGTIGCSDTSYVYLANSVIQNGESTYSSGGFYTSYSTVELVNNVFFNNKSEIEGGGIFGIYSTISISNIIVSNNYTTSSFGKGGGINLISCDAYLANNIVCNNQANEGGGIYCHNGNYTLINNTIANNQAFETGGGIYTNYNAEVEILNSIFWGNNAINGAQVYDGGNTTVSYCDVQGGFSGTGTGNIDSDPEFISPSLFYGPNYDGLNANWELKCYSPCINSGSPDTSNLPDFDFNNNPRIIDAIVDMGAFEYQYDITPLIIDGYINYNGIPIDTGYVKLFEYTYKSKMPVVDSVVISDSGYYQFEAVCHGQYIVCAYPDSNLYPEALRTYFGDTYYWEYATIIDFTDDTTTYSADINILELEISIGFNSLSGTIQSDELNPMLGIDALLEIPPDNVLRYRQSNSNGTYEFLSVPDGYYRILVDIPGLPMDSIHEVSFSENNFLSKESYDYLVNDSIIYIDKTTHSESIYSEESFSVFPNPCNGQFTIIDLQSNNQKFDIQIMDYNGRELMNKAVTNNTTIECQELPAGFYFVRLSSELGVKMIKLLIL